MKCGWQWIALVARTFQIAAMLALSLASRVALCGPIHDAARKGDQAKVVALLKQNPELVFSRDKFGNTPLHVAALHNKPDIAALLLANGADVNARVGKESRNAGETPLTIALNSYQHKEMLELLLTHGAEVNVLSGSMPPLFLAVNRDLPDDVELLLANGADPNVQNLLHIAVLHDRTKMLEILLDYGADPNPRDLWGHTPLYYARSKKAIALLRAHGAE